MPLLDLKTDLKSLKYGQDRPDGGSSNQPYIITDVSNPTTTLSLIVRNPVVKRILKEASNLSDTLGIGTFDVDNIINQVGGLIDRSTKFDDGFVRGGILGSANATAADVFRIGGFLTDTPKGPLFIARQVGLQLSNPKLEVKKGLRGTASGALSPGGLLGTLTGGILGPTRLYNLGINTIAQIPVNAFGGHFYRHGITPVQSNDTKYEAVVSFNNNSFKSRQNRLVELTTKFQLGDRQTNNTQPQGISNRFSNILGFFNAFISATGGSPIPLIKQDPKQLTIDSYLGGPGSIYGIGTTTINRTSFTEDGYLYSLSLRQSKQFAGKTKSNDGEPISVNYSTDVSQDKNAISNYNFPEAGSTSGVDQTTIKYYSPALKTYAELQNQIEKQNTAYSINYKNSKPVSLTFGQFGAVNELNISKIGNQLPTSNATPIYKNGYGEKVEVKIPWKTVTREIRVGSGRQDLINLTPLFESPGNPGNSVRINNKEYKTRDLVKFRIGAINTDKPGNTVWMVFRAYLKDFNDSFTANWNDIQYIGRGEKFYLYNGFTRQVTFNFRVAALSKQEMEPMYQKLNYLASNMMPDYKDKAEASSTVMRGPFVKLTIGDYLNAQQGIITSLQYSIADDTPWEISLDQPEGGSTMYDLPHIINVNVTFIPIGVNNGELPQKGESTPVMLQSGMVVDGQTNPWLKAKDKFTNKYTENPLVALPVEKNKSTNAVTPASIIKDPSTSTPKTLPTQANVPPGLRNATVTPINRL
jgi:hypothetical protein